MQKKQIRFYYALRIVIALIALYSMILGVLNWTITTYWLTWLQMPISADYPFWPKQSGAMHVGLALAYGLGAIIPRYLAASVWVIILSKIVAVLFLFSEYFMHSAPIILFVGFGDSSILIVTGVIAWNVYRCKDDQGQAIQD